MASKTKPIPEGLHALTPHLVVKDAAKTIEFYKRAFGAKETMRGSGPGGKIMHAELKIGDSTLFLGDEFPDMGARSPLSIGGAPTVLHLYVENADQVFNQAVAAGATVKMPIMDAFWGDRYGQVTDPSGHIWAIATRKEDLTPQEIQKRQEQFFAQMSKR
jgi:uncharacterized glyoxalase superfamily protein PhnB